MHEQDERGDERRAPVHHSERRLIESVLELVNSDEAVEISAICLIETSDRNEKARSDGSDMTISVCSRYSVECSSLCSLSDRSRVYCQNEEAAFFPRNQRGMKRLILHSHLESFQILSTRRVESVHNEETMPRFAHSIPPPSSPLPLQQFRPCLRVGGPREYADGAREAG